MVSKNINYAVNPANRETAVARAAALEAALALSTPHLLDCVQLIMCSASVVLLSLIS